MCPVNKHGTQMWGLFWFVHKKRTNDVYREKYARLSDPKHFPSQKASKQPTLAARRENVTQRGCKIRVQSERYTA